MKPVDCDVGIIGAGVAGLAAAGALANAGKNKTAQILPHSATGSMEREFFADGEVLCGRTQ